MANTIIQIKRSTSTSAPSTLNIAELAFSYQSNKLFIGNSAGDGVIEIGGDNIVLASAAFDKANAANLLAYGTGIGANAYADSVGASSNAYTDAVGINVGTGANSYADTVGTNAGAGANAYATSVGASGNAYAVVVGASSNAYADVVGTSANAYSAATFLPLTGGTISGDLVVSQNLTVSGVVTYANTQTLLIGDNIISLNADLPSDVAPSEDAGIEVNRGSSANVYLQWSEGIDKWQFTEDGSSFYTIPTNTAVETAQSAAEAAPGIANSYAVLVGAAGNAYADLVGTNAGTGANSFATSIGASSNAYAESIGTSGNAYAVSIATAVGAAGNSYTDTVGTNVGTGANSYAVTIGASSNAYAAVVGTSANVFATSIGASSNAYAETLAANGTYISTGTVAVAYGGTGKNTLTQNGILYGDGTNPIGVTASGTEGNVLQVNGSGVPQFGMLDGGSF
jgi:hypothetical protein